MFKDWEEKSKDPVNKQQRKEAKKLRKSMKNVKLEKNSSNATPIGLKKDAETIKSTNSPNKNTLRDSLVSVENTDEAIAVVDEKVGSKLSQNDSKPVPLSIAGVDTKEKEKIIDLKKGKNIPKKKVIPKKSIAKSHLKAVKLLNLNELQDSDEMPIEKTNGIGLNKNVLSISLTDVENTQEAIETDDRIVLSKNTSSNSLMNVENTEEAIETDDEQAKSKPSQNDSKPNSLSIIGIDAVEKEETSDSENEEMKEQTLAPRNKSPMKSHVEKTSRDIQSRLKAISNNSQKADTRGNRQFKARVNASKKSNSLKAVTMLNLNELQDFDEIPIEKKNEIEEETEDNKRKKDTFFLGKGGEVLSESEDEDSANRKQEMDRPALKKRKFDNYDRNSDDFSSRRSLLSDSSQNLRSNFRENSFQRNSSFGDRNNSFKSKERQSSDFRSKGFKNKSFGEKFPSQQFK